MNINCHVPGHESKELSVATSENNTVVGMYITGFLTQQFGNMTQPPELGIFQIVLYKIWKNSHHIYIIKSNKAKNQISYMPYLSPHTVR